MKYKIVHPSKDFNGVVETLRFTDGEAVLDTMNTSHLGNFTPEELLEKLEGRGCDVTSLKDKPSKSEKTESS